MGQRADGFRQVTAGGLVEVEHDRKVVAFSKRVTQRVEDCLSFRGEASQDQHDLRGDGVDHGTNLLVVQQ